MAEASDYFSNHALKLRFPWRLYHAPIVEQASRALVRAAGRDVLNIGSGPCFELDRLPLQGRRFTLCDIDPRAIDLARRLHGQKLAGADAIVADAPLPYADESFDVVMAMDVIEHVPDPLPWLRDVWRVLRPGGTAFMTTPNYGSVSLRAIESTALEAIARWQGFSRRAIHPSKFDERRLRSAFASLGASAHIDRIAFGWVLAVEAVKVS